MMQIVQPAFELFDHTADMGIRVRAGRLAELIHPAVDGLYAAIGELVPATQSALIWISLDGADRAVLFRDFLNEVLMLFEREKRMLTGMESVEFEESYLKVAAFASPVDVDRSVFHREVKAITYHELKIRAIDGGFEATLIVDI